MNTSSTVAKMRRQKEAGHRMEKLRREWREQPKGIDRELAYDDYKAARDEYLTTISDDAHDAAIADLI